MNFPYFVVVAGDDKDRKFPVHPGSGHLLGRHADASYRLHDHAIARFHCMINCLDGAVHVIDQTGTGGTLVNGAPVSARDLHHGDTLQVGETIIRYLTGPMTDEELHRPVPAPTDYDPREVDELAGLVGRSLSHYRLDAVLGRGAAGVVFAATDTAHADRPVALKVMQPTFTRHEAERQRFIKAMKALLPLDHPHLVKVYAAGQTGSVLWVAMERVDGESLAAVVRRFTPEAMPDWRYAFRIGLKVAKALVYAYEHGIVHRNVCPASVLIRSADREVKVAGLMLAKVADRGGGEAQVKPAELLGDVGYMSPERTAAGAVPVDHRSDLFSLGAMCYVLLTGAPPFQAMTATETVANIRTADPPPPRAVQPGLPPAFEGVVLKLLAKHPADRYHSAEDLVDELEQIGRDAGVIKA
jgi:serine/threonine-protein kinase